jgi:hypothetical protein
MTGQQDDQPNAVTVTGNPTPAELAAVLAVLLPAATTVGSAPARAVVGGALWGRPHAGGWIAAARRAMTEG